MLPWTRPIPHTSFADRSETLLAELQKDVADNGNRPEAKFLVKRHLWRASWYEAGYGWGIHRHTLEGAKTRYSKCVWCERLRDASRELDVEHYRPTLEIKEWTGDPPLISDTPPAQTSVGSGYWWLAFEWTNYSLACRTCNQGWKRNLFPVDPPRISPCVPGIEAREVPLLLDPGSSFRTRDHFRWTIEGIVEPVSPEGRATIITMGLNRNELLDRRAKTALDTKRALDRFVTALRNDTTDSEPAFAELRSRGSRREEFTSMVRWLVEERLGCRWEELLDFHAAVGAPIDAATATRWIENHRQAAGRGVASYTIQAAALRRILERPGCVGISLQYGVDDSGELQLFPIGVDGDGRGIADTAVPAEARRFIDQYTGTVKSHFFGRDTFTRLLDERRSETVRVTPALDDERAPQLLLSDEAAHL